MPDFAAFDVGGCHPVVQPVTETQRCVTTPEGSPFVASRRVYERGWRRVTLSWASVDLGVVYSLQDWWVRTLGGVLTMGYTPDNGEAAYEIRFRLGTRLAVQQLTAMMYSVTGEFEQRITS